MPTLKKIQENKLNNSKYNDYYSKNYKATPAINIIMSYLKEQNKEFIRKFIVNNNYDEKYIDILNKEFLKISNFTPGIFKKKIEKLQCY